MKGLVFLFLIHTEHVRRGKLKGNASGKHVAHEQHWQAYKISHIRYVLQVSMRLSLCASIMNKGGSMGARRIKPERVEGQ